MDNHTYNLVKALGEKAEAAEIYEIYGQDSTQCPECAELWKKLANEERADIQEMKNLLLDHAKQGKIA